LAVTTVLLADLPRMLEDMIAGVLQPHSDIRIVRGSAHDRDLIAAATAAGAHAVVVTRRDPASLDDIDPRLAQALRISIVALAPDGTSACVHALRSEATRLEDVSAREILRALAATRSIGGRDEGADARADERRHGSGSTRQGRG
jgi:hypothetical protein